MSHKRRPSLLGALLLTGIGILFLLDNFGFGPGFWSLARRYWPVVLILLGAGKIIEYFLKKDSVSIRAGEIVGILFLLFFGFVLSKIFYNPMGPFIPSFPDISWGPPAPPRPWIGDSHTYTEEESYPLESAIPIRIENSNGSISVSPGSDREIRVRLKKVISGSSSRAREIADKLHLEGVSERGNESPASPTPEAEPGLSGDGENFVIRTNRESLVSRDFRFNTDMEITVPKNSQIQIRNIIGEVRVSDINGDLDIRTTHGDLEVWNCIGDFTLSNRFADSRLTNLEGNVNLTSRGDGKVNIENIKGDVSVTSEYSDMEILEVDGEVSVSSTEGNMRVERISKPVVLEGLGTRIRAGDLNDSLKVMASHGDVDVFDVASDVVLESRYNSLSLKNIEGNIQIQSNADNVNADEIRGRLTLEARASSIRLNDIEGNLDIRTTLKDVIVNGFEGTCNIINEYADVSLSARRLEEGGIYVKNRNGGISLFLPEDSSFAIDAFARNGRVDSEYRGLGSARNENNTGSLKSSVGAGGPTITLETEYNDIHISHTRTQERSHVSIPGNVITPTVQRWSIDFDRALSTISRSGAHIFVQPAESLIGGLR